MGKINVSFIHSYIFNITSDVNYCYLTFLPKGVKDFKIFKNNQVIFSQIFGNYPKHYALLINFLCWYDSNQR